MIAPVQRKFYQEIEMKKSIIHLLPHMTLHVTSQVNQQYSWITTSPRVSHIKTDGDQLLILVTTYTQKGRKQYTLPAAVCH